MIVECTIKEIKGEKIIRQPYDTSKNEYISLPKDIVLPYDYIAKTEDDRKLIIWERENSYPLSLKIGQKVKIHRKPLLGIYRDFIESAEGQLAHVIISWN